MTGRNNWRKLPLAAAVCALAWGVISAAAQQASEPWPLAEWAAKLKEEPKTEADKAIKELIATYEAKIAELKADDPLVRANLPRLRHKLAPFYQEYNQDKARYRGDHFSPAECAKRFETDMNFQFTSLAAGKDPVAASAGRWQTRVAWIERTNVMGHFDLIVPRGYEPSKSWPLIISYQDDPDDKEVRQRSYFLIRAIQKGYPTGLTYVENKTRTYLKEAAREYNIDPLRIYATGFSYGGHTDLVVAWRYPHWFAAIMPICNDLRDKQTPYVRYLKNVPTFLVHGDHDAFLKTGQVIHKLMTEAGCPVAWATYPGGHNPVPFRGDVKMLTDFFDKHVMNPYPKTVSHVVEHRRYSRAFWVDAKLASDTGVASAAFEVSVKDGPAGQAGGSRIEVRTEKVIVEDPASFKLLPDDQIAELDLYLNDKLLDMSKPVTVVLLPAPGEKEGKEKVLYQGLPKEKLTVKLREAPDYARDGGDTLWRDLMEIRAQAAAADRGKEGEKARASFEFYTQGVRLTMDRLKKEIPRRENYAMQVAAKKVQDALAGLPAAVEKKAETDKAERKAAAEEAVKFFEQQMRAQLLGLRYDEAEMLAKLEALSRLLEKVETGK